jgi:hypothetical protein
MKKEVMQNARVIPYSFGFYCYASLLDFFYMNLLVIQMFYFIVSLLDHNQARVSM